MKTYQDNTRDRIISTYREKGYGLPLPIPVNKKAPLPKHTFGNRPRFNDTEALATWNGFGEGANLGLRLADNVLAIDVDHGYNGKTGATRLADLEEQLGDLPPTISSTRRGADSQSRQFFYRVAPGAKWVGDAGKGVDIISRMYRFSTVAPSVVDGMEYQWYGVDRAPMAVEDLPRVDEIPELPEAWQTGSSRFRVR